MRRRLIEVLRDAPKMLLLGGLYALLATVVLRHFSPNGIVSIVWPCSGLGLAVLLLGGQKRWPAVFLGALLANLEASGTLLLSVCIAVGNTLEALAGRRLLLRNGCCGVRFDTPADYARFCLVACLSSCVSAAIGNAALTISGYIGVSTLAENLAHWWQGDVLGIALVAPLIVIWRQMPRAWLDSKRLPETLACFGLAWLFGQSIFIGWFHADVGVVAYDYWMFLFVIWGALRYGRHGALLIASVAAMQALWGAAHGEGFFGRDIARTGLLNLWFYLTALTTIGMMLALAIRARNKAELQLRRSEAHFRFVAESAQAMIWMSGTDKLCTWFNKEWLDFTGRSMEQELGDGWAQGVHPEDFERAAAIYADHFDRRLPFAMEYRLRRRDGEYRWILDQGAPRHDADGAFDGYIGSCFDITERKSRENELQLAATVYQAIGEAIMVADADNRIVMVNSAFVELTGYSADEAVGSKTSLLKSGRQDRQFYQQMWRALHATGHWQGEIVNRRKDGSEYTEWLMISTIYEPEGKVLRRVAMFSDITDRKIAEETIWRQANYDPLTELPNRNMFLDRLKEEIKRADRGGHSLALLFIDLDRFKDVNDSLGHDVGDTLLKAAALRIGACVRATDAVARLAGDEFTVLLSDLNDTTDVARIAGKILAGFEEPFRLQGEAIYISTSIGIAMYPADASNSDMLLRNADQAMYAAKRQGRKRLHFYTATMHELTQERLRLGAELRTALTLGQFILHYQPIVDLATGEVRKAEALLRWHHPRRGLVGPSEFISHAEELGIISDIGDWVFAQAANQASVWRRTLHPDFQLSINKSPVQFRNDTGQRLRWLRRLDELQMPGLAIAIEITENLLLENSETVLAALLEFRRAGVQISLDDFGTGYSSLVYLKHFSLDFLKIDRSFVRNLEPNSGDLAMCEAIIVMAHKLGIEVIAEGVESGEHHRLLIGAGCDYAQGFFLSPALPAAEFERWFEDFRESGTRRESGPVNAA